MGRPTVVKAVMVTTIWKASSAPRRTCRTGCRVAAAALSPPGPRTPSAMANAPKAQKRSMAMKTGG